MTVAGSLGVDRLLQVELLDHHTRTEIKVLADDVDELRVLL